jgi:hypothetical protein
MRGVPHSARVAALEACRDELARRAAQHQERISAGAGGALDPSFGREMDAIASRLAQARSELVRLRASRA